MNHYSDASMDGMRSEEMVFFVGVGYMDHVLIFGLVLEYLTTGWIES